MKNRKELKNYFLKIKNEVLKRIDFFTSVLKEKNIQFIKPEGGIAMFIRIPDSFENAFSFCQTLLDKERVAVAPGEIFGQRRYFRVNLAVDFNDLKETAKGIIKYYE